MSPMELSMTYEWEVLRFPDIVVVDSHEDDSGNEGQAAETIRIPEVSHAQDISDEVGDLGDVCQPWCETQSR